MPKSFHPKISPPTLFEGNQHEFGVEPTLGDLPLYEFQVEIGCIGTEVARVFEQYPSLPGAILVNDGQFVGMISRRRMLEYLLLPQGLQLFLTQPLEVLYSYARTDILILPETMSIVTATGQALRRSPELIAEPVVVKGNNRTLRLLDIHELHLASWQIRGIDAQVRYERIQAQTIQSEKMANLGRLVDGVAHEILDPISFIWGNLTYVSTYTQSLMELAETYEKYLPELPAEIEQLKEDIDLEFIQQDLPRSLQSIMTGAERLKQLAIGLQNFCHIDEIYPKPADIHASLDSIVLLLKSRLGSDIQIIRNYGKLPPVPCFISQLNQVFMNILTNAVNALLDRAVALKFAVEFQGKDPRDFHYQPSIEIVTEVCSLEPSQPGKPDSRWVRIAIADNGPGLSERAKQEILDSFSVERRAEKETSLALSYWIITSRHGGKFNLRSRNTCDAIDKLETGTEFEIFLPLIG